MFDLPTLSEKEVKNANKFRKFLIKNGFIMMTFSVYCKLAINKSISESIKKLVQENVPPSGKIQLLEITERQYTQIEYLLGDPQTLVIDDVDRYTEI
jgi:CRISPR-associated protein Cas2